MKDSVLVRRNGKIVEIARDEWEQLRLSGVAEALEEELRFMSADHHRVRNFAVQELPRAGRPLPPGMIAGALGLELETAVGLLQELEEHLTFLYRNHRGEVVWAYPVTVEQTPHHATFSTGERLYAA